VPNWFAQYSHIHAHPVPEDMLNWTHWLEGVGVFGQISVMAWANKNNVVYSSVLRFIYSLCIFCFYMGFVLQCILQ